MRNDIAADVRKLKISAAATDSQKTISVRVSPNSYTTGLFLVTFFSGFLIYLEIDWAAIALLALGWLAFPFLAWNDRIAFDGKRLTRTGHLPRAWAWFNDSRLRLKISAIEQIETQSLRTLKRGGNVFYRYRTSVQGKDLKFVFASGGEDYRRMTRALFPLLPENSLDNRSLELRDYLTEPKDALMKAEFAKIPSVEVLENSINEFQNPGKNLRMKNFAKEIGKDAIEQAEYLRRLANELRVSGYLLQSLETFRRALFLNPQSAWLLFDFARCLHSFAGSEKDKKLERKAFAVLRLAEIRARDNGEILARLGESYFQYGDQRRARMIFQKAVEVAEASFRSVRGLAEISLREGKIAHVIHHFSTASRLAETSALRRWTKTEGEYFSRLNADEDYMEMEISRINLLETLERSKKSCLRISLIGFPTIIFGLLADDALVCNVGWAVSTVALLIWAGLIVSQNFLSARLPLDLHEEESD